MALFGKYMYNSVMITGESPQTPLEYALHDLKIRVSTSRRMVIDPGMWRLDIMSPFWRIYVQNRPGARLYFGGESLELLEGAVYVVPAWLRFQTDVTDPVEQDFIHFYLHGIPPALQKRLFPLPLAVDMQDHVRNLVRIWQLNLLSASNGSGLAVFCLANALVHSCMAGILGGLSDSATEEFLRLFSGSSPVQKALDRMDADMASPPSNRELAALCNLSEDHFIRVFRHETGCTPARYCLDRRVDAATGMLADTSRSIAEIAEATGFVDRFHLSRILKQSIGVTPALYRRRFS